MGNILDVIFNPILVVSLCSWLVAQTIKFFVNGFVHKKFSIGRFVGDGGMPSAHSATVSALACMTGIVEGFASTAFAIAFVLAVIVMHDASGVRRETGKQAAVIKSAVSVINDYFAEKDAEIRTEKLKELVGHTRLQVFCGALVGLLTSIVYYFVF